MRNYIYPARVTRIAENDFLVRFRDVPEVVTGGDDPAAALANAPDALACAIEGYLESGVPAPAPSAAMEGETLIALDPDLAARVLLVEAMAAQGLTKVALAARMNRDEKAVRRILSGKGASFRATLEALHALGVRPALAV